MSGWDTANDDGWGGGQDAAAATAGNYSSEIGGGAGGNTDGNDDNGRTDDRACFNCGQAGHQKSECTNEAVAREFTGECRGCGEVGHRKADCPDAAPVLCKNCNQDDHLINACKNPRKDPWAAYKTMTPDKAWELMKEALVDRDVYDLKEACLCYLKAVPDATLVDLGEALENMKPPGYLVAIESEAGELYTFMDAQGNLNKKYQATFRFHFSPQRNADIEAFPKTKEENKERLKDAGVTVDCLMEKCANCNELGHSRKYCKQEKEEYARAKVACVNCDKEGHRSRDCPEQRKDKFACKNCGNSGHPAKECPEPRNPATVQCKECEEMGHFSRDCPTKPQIPCFNCGQTGHRKADCTNEAVLMCRNCDAQGHVAKDCPEKKDWSRVKCRNCGETGHTQVRCTQAVQDDNNEGGGGGGGYGNETTMATTTEDFASNDANAGGNGW